MIEVFVLLIVFLIIVGVFYWAATKLLGIFALPEPFAHAITVLLQVFAALIVLAAFLQAGGLWSAGLPLIKSFR